jgi:hypothetical protein
MEPTGMTSLDNPQLDTLLRESAGPPLPDDGFSARVLVSLPPRRKPRHWFRSGFLAASALLGFAFAWMRSAGNLGWGAMDNQLSAVLNAVPALLADPVEFFIVLTMALWLLPTFTTEEIFE